MIFELFFILLHHFVFLLRSFVFFVLVFLIPPNWKEINTHFGPEEFSNKLLSILLNPVHVLVNVLFKASKASCGHPWADWFICYFRVLGKSFRGDLGRVLTCFPDSFRSIFQTKFPEKIAENYFDTLLKPFKGP